MCSAEVKSPITSVPSAPTAAKITPAIRDANSAYSTAVAPFSLVSCSVVSDANGLVIMISMDNDGCGGLAENAAQRDAERFECNYQQC